MIRLAALAGLIAAPCLAQPLDPTLDNAWFQQKFDGGEWVCRCPDFPVVREFTCKFKWRTKTGAAPPSIPAGVKRECSKDLNTEQLRRDERDGN